MLIALPPNTVRLLRCARLWALLVLCICPTASWATAYTANDYNLALQSVTQRQTSFTTPRGWHSGSFLVQPTLDIQAGYSDNIRSTATQRLGDLATRITPALQYSTIRRDRGFDSTLRFQQVLFKTYTAQNQTNAAFRLSPFFELSDGWRFIGQTAIRYDHELPGAESAQPLANRPTAYTDYTLGGTLQHGPGRLLTEFFTSYDVLNFTNTDLINGGLAVNNDRNRSDTTVGFTCSWRNKTHNQSVGWRHEFLDQNFSRADFDSLTGNYSGFNRDNHGWRSQFTAEWQPTHLIHFDGRIGVEQKNFSTPQWQNRLTPIGSLKALYLITPLTNIYVNAERSVAITSFDNAPAFTQQSTRAGLTHELTRRTVADISLSRTTADYWNNERRDTSYNGELNVSYQQNSAVLWQADYRYQQRDSSFSIADYAENRFMIGTHIRF